MWIFLTGYLLSDIFEQGTIKLFKEKFSNKTLSIDKIIIGWLFQEYTREKFGMTGGKTFILESDYRNQFLTQIFKIVTNFFLYSHLITFLELGTFLIFFGTFFYIIFKTYVIKLKNQFVFKPILEKKYLFKNYEFTFNQILNLVSSNWNLTINKLFLFSCLFSIFRYGFLKKFSWFDVFFILRPILLTFFLICSLISSFILSYLLYIIVFKKISKLLAFIFKLCIKKTICYLIYLFNFLKVFSCVVNSQNLTTENFLKEIFFTLITFFSL